MVFGESFFAFNVNALLWASIISATTPELTPAAMLVPLSRRYLLVESAEATTREFG